MKRFNFYFGEEADQFTFYRIPKVLFSDDFKELSSEAKILYGLMLDRMSLSIKNQWMDERGRVFIIFPLEEIIQYLNCGKDKGVKLLSELDLIGLTERKKQGCGKPSLIYVKNFIEEDAEQEELQTSEKSKSSGVKSRSLEVGKTEVMKSEKPKSGGRKSRSHEVGKTEVWRSEKPKSRLRKNRHN